MARPAREFYVPPGYWTAQRALKELPETPEQTIEVFDGGLYVSPRPGAEHQVALRELCYLLDKAALSAGLTAMPEINLVLGDDLASPDVTVLPRPTKGRTWFNASEAKLVVEIMSPNHKRKDRRERPEKYAENGIPYFMRVEFRGDDPVIFLHELTDRQEYRPIAVAAAGTTFAMRQPFEFAIDPAQLRES